jgi:hypothetical protein
LADFWLGDRNQVNAEPMKVLLQHSESGHYFKEVGVTTSERSDAMDFLSSTQAIEYCTIHKITGVQIVLRFDEQHYDIVLPMSPGQRHSHMRRAPAV